jgi:hypothetical protein
MRTSAVPARRAAGTHLGCLDKGPQRNPRYGSLNSTKRSAEQATIGRFWFFTGPRTYNAIVRQMATARNMDLVDSARLYALAAMAASAFIAVFDGKPAAVWRPVTAIRNADTTNNPATPRELMGAARHHADASGIPLRALHRRRGRVRCAAERRGNEVGEIVNGAASPQWTRLQDYSDEVSNARA